MKRFAAISLLCLLLFNIAGYRLWFYFAEREATAQLLATVEQQQYEAAELITLSVPLTLPYQTDWTDWEQVRGEIEIDGITYQYVQRKVEAGKLVLQCLPNHQQAKIESARDRFFGLANSFHDGAAGKKAPDGHMVKLTKPALTDYDDFSNTWRLPAFDAGLAQKRHNYHQPLCHRAPVIPAQPPELIG